MSDYLSVKTEHTINGRSIGAIKLGRGKGECYTIWEGNSDNRGVWLADKSGEYFVRLVFVGYGEFNQDAPITCIKTDGESIASLFESGVIADRIEDCSFLIVGEKER